MAKRISSQEIWELACYLTALLIEKGMWADARVFFLGQTFQTEGYAEKDDCFEVRDSEGNTHYVGIAYGVFPENYFRFAGSILSVSCEAGLTNFALYDKDFLALDDKLTEKYGLYFELGADWNMSLYHI